ncbi:LRR receptor-like serine/threonine-protein kinase EFR [Forsythia ovata]|uniref:LRR receptor-like serine/threonine-protein kinase EFR n=1 Tax=Forsythia ovata TaxID=205694 RepID=A0ABD1VN46_9LAMI
MEKIGYLIAVAVLSVNCFALYSSNTDEEALLAFKTGITSDPYEILADNCRNRQRVIALNFSGFNFGGIIGPHLGNLTFLSSLDKINLGFNSFIGEVPSWFGTLPELKQILLNNKNFTGSIPPSLCNNSKLQTLQMDYNFINGNIP